MFPSVPAGPLHISFTHEKQFKIPYLAIHVGQLSIVIGQIITLYHLKHTFLGFRICTDLAA